jgi:hypothetical protein
MTRDVIVPTTGSRDVANVVAAVNTINSSFYINTIGFQMV